MEKNREKKSKNDDKTSLSLASSAAATMIGFSVAIITLLVRGENLLVDFPNGIYIFVFFILAIISYIFSIEFLNLSSWDKKNHDIWAAIGSVVYGLGYGWVIVGLSLIFKILVSSIFLAYFTLTSFTLGFIIYYFLRWKITEKEFYLNIRIVARIIMIIQIFIGYIAIYLLH